MFKATQRRGSWGRGRTPCPTAHFIDGLGGPDYIDSAFFNDMWSYELQSSRASLPVDVVVGPVPAGDPDLAFQ